jgi:hypothetical protein
MPMTIAELIGDLRAAKHHFEWEFDGAHNWIRGVLKDPDIKISLDPIAAVCFFKTQKLFLDAEWIEAGETIGLSSADCMDVLEAAYNRRTDDIYNEWLRRQIVHAVGLQSEPIPAAALESIFNLVVTRI